MWSLIRYHLTVRAVQHRCGVPLQQQTYMTQRTVICGDNEAANKLLVLTTRHFLVALSLSRPNPLRVATGEEAQRILPP